MEWWPDSDGEISNHRFWPISISIHLWMSTLYVFVLSSCANCRKSFAWAGNAGPRCLSCCRAAGQQFWWLEGVGVQHCLTSLSDVNAVKNGRCLFHTQGNGRIVSHHWHWHTQLAQVAAAACFGRIYKHTVYTNKYSIGMMIVTWSYYYKLICPCNYCADMDGQKLDESTTDESHAGPCPA